MGARAQHSPAYRDMRALLRRWRIEAHLTQRAMALELRKPHSFIFKVEAGERRIDPIEFIRWCRATGVDPAAGLRAVERAI